MSKQRSAAELKARRIWWRWKGSNLRSARIMIPQLYQLSYTADVVVPMKVIELERAPGIEPG